MLSRPVKYDDGIEATELVSSGRIGVFTAHVYAVSCQSTSGGCQSETTEGAERDHGDVRLARCSRVSLRVVASDYAKSKQRHKTEGSLHTHEAAVKLLDQICKAPAVLELKVGCQVMLITNIKGGEGGLFNGSLWVTNTFRAASADLSQGKNHWF
jgi:hypothetical protein